MLQRILLEVDKDSEVVFYYAGHGVQIGGANYLIPVDATFRDAYDLPFEAVSLTTIVNVLGARARTQIVILDSCRSNPFAGALVLADITGTPSQPRDGFNVLTAPVNSLLAFSTSPGANAYDGTGANSPFTAALVDEAHRTPEEPIGTPARGGAPAGLCRAPRASRSPGRARPWCSRSPSASPTPARSSPPPKAATASPCPRRRPTRRRPPRRAPPIALTAPARPGDRRRPAPRRRPRPARPTRRSRIAAPPDERPPPRRPRRRAPRRRRPPARPDRRRPRDARLRSPRRGAAGPTGERQLHRRGRRRRAGGGPARPRARPLRPRGRRPPRPRGRRPRPLPERDRPRRRRSRPASRRWRAPRTSAASTTSSAGSSSPCATSTPPRPPSSAARELGHTRAWVALGLMAANADARTRGLGDDAPAPPEALALFQARRRRRRPLRHALARPRAPAPRTRRGDPPPRLPAPAAGGRVRAHLLDERARRLLHEPGLPRRRPAARAELHPRVRRPGRHLRLLQPRARLPRRARRRRPGPPGGGRMVREGGGRRAPGAPGTLGRLWNSGALGETGRDAKAIDWYDKGLARCDGWSGANAAWIIANRAPAGYLPRDAAERAAKAAVLERRGLRRRGPAPPRDPRRARRSTAPPRASSTPSAATSRSTVTSDPRA